MCGISMAVRLGPASASSSPDPHSRPRPRAAGPGGAGERGPQGGAARQGDAGELAAGGQEGAGGGAGHQAPRPAPLPLALAQGAGGVGRSLRRPSSWCGAGLRRKLSASSWAPVQVRGARIQPCGHATIAAWPQAGCSPVLPRAGVAAACCHVGAVQAWFGWGLNACVLPAQWYGALVPASRPQAACCLSPMSEE